MTQIVRGKDTLQVLARHSSLRLRPSSSINLCPLKCYACLSLNHSQKTCPLRFCSTCHTYGHTSKECKDHGISGTSWRDSDLKKSREPTFKRFTHLSQRKRHSSFFRDLQPAVRTSFREGLTIDKLDNAWNSIKSYEPVRNKPRMSTMVLQPRSEIPAALETEIQLKSTVSEQKNVKVDQSV